MKITPDAETIPNAPYTFTLKVNGNSDAPGHPNEITVTFTESLTKEEESELSAWLLKVQKRIHSIERPPFSFQTESVSGTPTNAPLIR